MKYPINYLPGVIVNTLDGGLTAAFAPQDDSILVIGTTGEGLCNTPYQVTDRALAAQQFGFAGSLERGIEECATNSDNILAFRCGTSPMILKGVGLDTTIGSTSPGFTITFSDVTSDAGTRYQIWYKAGVPSVWKDGTLEHSNGVNAAVDNLINRTRCLRSAVHKILRARGEVRLDLAGPQLAAPRRKAMIF
jgi:hypothetical protein